MYNTCVDMPFLNNIFGLAPPKSPTPKPASKRRAVHDEQEELGDIPMEQINEEDPAPSNPQATKDVDMAQADYDRESDSTVQESDTVDEEKRKEQLSGERHQPKQKAMPMNLLTLRLTPKIKASPQSAFDEETEKGTIAQKTNNAVSSSIYRSIQMDHIELEGIRSS